MQEIEKITEYLKNYDGPLIRIMEVCGSHTGAITKFGIREMLSDRIKLVSGPGCPVCVTPSAYIDRLIELALEPDTCVVTFGDMMRVPGSRMSLSQAKGLGAKVRMVYSPMDVVALAKKDESAMFVFAAVGFETTTPVYALLMEQIINEKIENIRFLTALKTMPEAIDYLCSNGAADGFLAPGHVCVITGWDTFSPLAEKYGIPFGVAGFMARELLVAIYGIVKHINQPGVMNYYPSAVTKNGNELAREKVDRFFEKSDAVWRGMGEIKNSGLVLREEFGRYDMGSRELREDIKINKGCRCGDVLMGKISPGECGLFGKVCNPGNPQGPCMVSMEGACFHSASGLCY